jgi:hypothetical protein
MEDKPTRRLFWTAAIVVVVVVMPLLYVLSAGPSVWLYHSGWLSEPWDDILRDAYYPITLAQEKLPALAAYLEWWKPARPIGKPRQPIPIHKFRPLQAREAVSPDENRSELPDP